MTPCSIQLARHRGDLRGFTLVEILIVVFILGILAALVLPKFASASLESQAAATATICHTVQQKIIEHNAIYGSYPSAIDPEWFVNKALPKSPFEPDMDSTVDYVSLSAPIKHPVVKIVNSSNKPYWYNTTNGVFRARVSRATPTSKIVALYNKANATNVTSITQTR